jgi:hypothetical protein
VIVELLLIYLLSGLHRHSAPIINLKKDLLEYSLDVFGDVLGKRLLQKFLIVYCGTLFFKALHLRLLLRAYLQRVSS